MNELGQRLREAREAQNLTLAEVEAKTRIRQRFLAALEAEEWDVLPGEVTIRGFLRKYATFLGLDADEVIQHYRELSTPPEIIETAEQPVEKREVDYRPIELSLHTEVLRDIDWRPLVALLAVILLALSIWLVFTFRPDWISSLAALPRSLPQPGELIALEAASEPTPTRTLTRVTATSTSTQPATATREGQAIANMAQQSAVAATAVGANQPTDKLQLHLKVNQRAWVRVTVDGQVRLETILEPGQEVTWEAEQDIKLRTGNAAGIEVSVNDRPYPPLGGSGEVVEVDWHLQEGKIIVSTPTPTLAATATVKAQIARGNPSTPTVTLTTTIVATATKAPTTPTSTPIPVSAEATVAQPADKLTLQIRITEPAWIRVTVDGKKRLEKTLNPGAEQMWEGQQWIQMRVGNAGGVEVTINGQERGRLGKSGQVLDLVWSLQDDGSIVEATPTPTPTPTVESTNETSRSIAASSQG